MNKKVETDLTGDVLLKFFKQTNAFTSSLSTLKSSITAASADKVLNLGFCKIAFKFDLFKFASKLENLIPISKPEDERLLDFKPLSVGVHAKLDNDSLAWLNKNVATCFPEVLPKESQVVMSLQASATFDYKSYFRDALVSEIDRQIKKKQKEVLKNIETIADDLKDGNPTKKGKAAAKALKSNTKVLQKLAEKGGSEVRDKVLKETGESAGKLLMKKVGKTILVKLIPGLNVLSTLYDIYQLGALIWDLYKKSLQTDYTWIKANATGITPGFLKFSISRVSLKNEYYKELMGSHEEGELLNSDFSYDMKIEISLTNCTSPAILEKEEEGSLTLNNCFPMGRALLSDQVAEEFIQWFDKKGYKLSDIQPQ